jgi:hypothetical protein
MDVIGFLRTSRREGADEINGDVLEVLTDVWFVFTLYGIIE